jgi:hypothetical protein
MSDCNKIIVDVYNHPDLLLLISKIKPENVQDDLRQEIAISLLEQDCSRIAALFANDNLLRYVMKVCWLMATSKTSAFYTKFRKSDLIKAVEYLKSQEKLPELPISLALKAKEHLSTKNQTIYDEHEVRIFNKYVELGSCRKVAYYFGIPINHSCNVVSKVKKELKCILQQQDF